MFRIPTSARLVSWIFVSLVFPGGALAAQDAAVRGRVTDGLTGVGIAGADVVVLDALGVATCRGLTGDRGDFTLLCRRVSGATLRVSRVGYQGAEELLPTETGAPVRIDVSLQPGVERLEPLVVTATREARSLSSAAAAVTVLGGGQLRRTAPTELASGLGAVPGLNAARSSGGGFDFSARGFNSSSSRRMILLVDGRRASTSNVLGFVGWDGLPFGLLEVDRVEVLKGPGAALYGANAHSGLVQVVTRDPADMRGTTVDAGAGELGTVWTDVVQGGSAGRVDYSASAGYMTADEWPLAAGTGFLAGAQTIPYTEAVDPAGERTRLRANLSTAFDVSGGRLRLSAGASRRDGTWVTGAGRVEQDGTEYRYAAARFESPAWTVLANANWNDSGDWVLLRNGQKFYEMSRDAGAEAHRRVRMGDRGQLLLGGDYRHIRADTRNVTFPGVRTQNLFGAFAQGEAALGSRVHATLAARMDHHPQSGWQFSPKVGVVASPAPDHTLHASFAEGYQNASLVELFIELAIPQPNGATIFVQGKPNLDPERVRSFEAGYRGFLGGVLRVSVDAFHQELEGFISDLVPVSPDPVTLSYRQEGSATVEGLDAALTWFVTPRLRVDQGYSYLSASGTDEPLNAPAHRWTGGIRYDHGSGVFLSGSVTHVSAFPWRAGQLDADVSAYTPVDAGLGYSAPDGRWRIMLHAANLLDDEHMEMAGGALLGRRITTRVTVGF